MPFAASISKSKRARRSASSGRTAQASPPPSRSCAPWLTPPRGPPGSRVTTWSGSGTFQGIIFLALAGVAHVPYDPVLLLTLVGELLLLSFTLTVFGHLSISPLALTALSPGVTWDGWLVPLGLSLAMVAAMGFVMLAIAIAEFRKTE